MIGKFETYSRDLAANHYNGSVAHTHQLMQLGMCMYVCMYVCFFNILILSGVKQKIILSRYTTVYEGIVQKIALKLKTFPCLFLSCRKSIVLLLIKRP